jgi:serine/threonine-protein kinase SRPK1
VLLCVDEPYIRKIAVEANEMVAMGMKLPTSLVSTAPEEFQPQVPTGKLSKTQKKKLKKKAKLQNELIKLQMEHLQQTEQDESKGTKEGGDHLSATATLSNNDESPTDNETSSHILNGSMKSNASSENENDEKEKNNMSASVKSNDESNEDNEEIDENVKMSNSSPPSECVIDEDPKVIASSQPIENGSSEHSKRSVPLADPTFEVCDFEVKIADLGNACWVDKHFTEGE